MPDVKLYLGDCLEVLRTLEDDSVDAVVTDPPYGLSFMGKKWDYSVPSVEIWQECLRVLKPGGHLLSFAGTRTYHRMAVNIEDGGFEIRDMIAWVYGVGFPKSLNVGKAIDKMQGNEREWISKSPYKASEEAELATCGKCQSGRTTHPDITKGTSEFEGFGSALKPAHEPIAVARKPIEGTIAANVLKWGTGAINIDGCRVEYQNETDNRIGTDAKAGGSKDGMYGGYSNVKDKNIQMYKSQGRFPANFIHDGSDEVVGLFPVSNGNGKGYTPANTEKTEADSAIYGFAKYENMHKSWAHHGDTGSAARFFYSAKASKRDRDEGLEDGEHSSHPTVKPTNLMRYLCRLVTPPGGIVLDPFMGSGSTGKGAVLEGFNFIGIELDEEYYTIAEKRISYAQTQPRLEGL